MSGKIDGVIVNVQMAMSSMICVEQSRGRSDPNIDGHPSTDVPLALRIVVVKYI